MLNPHHDDAANQNSQLDRFIYLSLGYGDPGMVSRDRCSFGKLVAGTGWACAVYYWLGRDLETLALGQKALFPVGETASRIWPLGRLGFKAE
jgi:hypothetical protein